MSGKKFINEKHLQIKNTLYCNDRMATYRHPLTLQESRIFTLICMQMSKHDVVGDYYRIPWKTFKALSPGMNTKQKLTVFLSELAKKQIIGDGAQETGIIPYIGPSKFKVGEYVDISVNREMINLILEWKENNYLTAHFECLFYFKSAHAWRLYFVLAPRAYDNSRPLDITVERLKFLLNIDSKSVTYKNFGNIRNKILLPVQKMFKETSNFQFTFETLPKGGRGKRVDAVRFHVGDVTRRQITLLEKINETLIEALDVRDKRNQQKAEELKPEINIKDAIGARMEREKDQYTMTKDGITSLCFYAGNMFVFVNEAAFPAMTHNEARALIDAGIIEKVD